MIERLRYIVTTDSTGFNQLRTIGVAAFAAVAAAGAAAIRIAADFDRELSELAGVSRATSAQIEQLAEQARDLGRSTEFTATQVVGLQTAFARLGFQTDEILNASGGILDLALGLRADLAPAAELVGNVLNGFGIEASESRDTIDVLARAATDSALDFERLSNSIGLLGPASRSLGLDLRDTAAILGVLANNSISGSMAFTSLRRIAIELGDENLTLSDAFDRVNGSANTFATSNELVGDRAGTALDILARNRDELEALRLSYDDVTGSSSDLATTIGDNLTGDVRELNSALEGLAITIGGNDGVTSNLRDLVQQTTTFIGGIDTLISRTAGLRRFLSTFGGLFDPGANVLGQQQTLNITDIPEVVASDPDNLFNNRQPANPTTSTTGGSTPSRQGFFNPFAFNQGADAFTGVGSTSDFGFNTEDNPFTQMADASDDATERIMSNNLDLSGSFAGLGGALASGLGGGEQALQAFVAAVIPELVQLALASGVTSAAQSAAGSGPAAAFVLPALLALTGGLISSAFGSAGVSSPSAGAALNSGAASGGFIGGSNQDAGAPVVFNIDGQEFLGMMRAAETSSALTI